MRNIKKLPHFVMFEVIPILCMFSLGNRDANVNETEAIPSFLQNILNKK